MNDRFQALVLGTVFAVFVGWVLYIGQNIFIPIVFSVLVVYVIIGMTRLLARIPKLGPALPMQAHYGLSLLVIVAVMAVVGWLVMNSVNQMIGQAPHYQSSLVSMVQQGAIFMGIESEPSWPTIRQSVLDQVNLQKMAGLIVLSITSIVTSLAVVSLYVAFLLLERGPFGRKIDKLSHDPERVARIRRVINDINGRIGTYLALKTLLSVLLGFVSWIILKWMGVELAAFWALLIGLLNYVPYIGSVLGVLLPGAFALLQFGDIKTVVIIALLLSVAQFLIGNILDPFLMGNSLNLSPFMILVSLTVWTALWGIPGAFLAVPVTASIVMILAEFEGTRPIAILLSQKG